MGKRGPSKKYPEQLRVRVPEKLYEKVQKKADNEGVSRSELLRNHLSDWLEDVQVEPGTDPDQVDLEEKTQGDSQESDPFGFSDPGDSEEPVF